MQSITALNCFLQSFLRRIYQSLYSFRNYAFIILSLFLFTGLTGCSNSGGMEKSDVGKLSFATDNGGITLPDGFKAVVVADTIGAARHIAVRDNGDIYVALRHPKNGGGIAAMRDTDGDGKADVIKYFGEEGGTGIGIHDGYLYFSPDTALYRYPLKEGQLVPSEPYQVVISGFPVQHQHAPKTFTFDNDENVYVNVGAPSNACQEQDRTKGSPGQDPCPLLKRHGGIWQFKANKLGQTQVDDGHRYATGIRNAVANAWKPDVNKLYILQHGRDQLHQLWPDLYTEEESAILPAEEFFKVEDGDNFGWPFTYYDQVKGKKLLNPEYGGDGEKVGRAAQYEKPIMGFPGHWAPDGLLFYTGTQYPSRFKNGAFIAFHGSWNRAPLPQAGYKIVYVPFDGELPSDGYKTFADGFKGAETLDSPGDAKHRPVGLSQGPDGSLYVTDDQNGRIWRIVYTGDGSDSM